eukprot:TRINITY_DN2096_c0_g1::TRINITY_DN2096_c0_g1_i1::g.21763::m.21763 TRINITY_DN2096_c0_g1::TRINITY_DN2096_c0_g1_i1::g.21763  ORF type:complete len:341 (+),score=13.93,PhyH/PF05721.8/3.6e+02,PhyH/PF05721.8/0.0011,DUF1479/PF07350.7/79,DUF1479/PF07350.7/0.23 TRINITY_DN2096_c0_g1_i1:83-1105(+)
MNPQDIPQYSRNPEGELPRIRVGDIEGARKALNEYGACIFENVATKEQLDTAEQLFWKWMKATELGFDPTQPNTFDSESWKDLGFMHHGVIANYGIGQSEFLWYCRLLEGVKNVFATVWDVNASDLLTSFDGCGVARNPWKGASDWLIQGNWFHVDQNYHANAGLITYQGFLNFYPTSKGSGGNVLVPGSHLRFKEAFQDKYRQNLRPSTAFVKFNHPGDDEKYCKTAIQPRLSSGDFLVWDSRTIHCGQGVDMCQPQSEVMAGRENHILTRLVAYICMVPRAHITDVTTLQRRKECVLSGLTSGHNPVVPARVLKMRDNGESVGTIDATNAKHPCWSLV